MSKKRNGSNTPPSTYMLAAKLAYKINIIKGSKTLDVWGQSDCDWPEGRNYFDPIHGCSTVAYQLFLNEYS